MNQKKMITDPSGPSPRYQQVKDFILSRITSGDWPPNTRIPSETELVGSSGVSRMTVNRALRELAAEGLLIRIQGVGTFVASPKPQSALLEIRSIAHEVRDRGGTHSSKVLVLARDRASPKLAVAMGLAPNAEVFHSVLIHLENGQPVQYADRYVNPAVAPDYLKQDFTAMTSRRYWLGVMPDTRIRKLLEMGINEPCLVVHRRTWTYQLVATKSKFFYPGSRYQLGGRFKPSSGSKLSVA